MRLTDLTLILPDHVGSLATTFGALDRAGVEVFGCGGFPAWAGEGILHVMVEDVDGASAALREAGIPIREEREILITGPVAGTSEIAELLAQLAAAGVNIDLVYQLRGDRLAIGVRDLDRARRAAAPIIAGETV
jgi:hypothetical protein